MRSGGLRQPPSLPEAAGTGWNRLEPAAPAREPTPHKGRRRLTASISLREAGLGRGGGWEGARRSGSTPPPPLLPFLRPRAALGRETRPPPPRPRGLAPTPLGLLPASSSRLSRFSRLEAGIWDAPWRHCHF